MLLYLILIYRHPDYLVAIPLGSDCHDMYIWCLYYCFFFIILTGLRKISVAAMFATRDGDGKASEFSEVSIGWI
jgi:hypothetical protein